MNKLSAKEKDLLARVDETEDLRPLFFRKVEGLKWFDELSDRGYFRPTEIPSPMPSQEEGYVTIPNWPVVDYLEKTSAELHHNDSNDYSQKFLSILKSTTDYAREKEFGNYRTWWKFSKIIANVPVEHIEPDHMDMVDYWLDDKYERGLVSSQIGENWLPSLIADGGEHELKLAESLLSSIYKVSFTNRTVGDRVSRDAMLRVDSYHAKKITEKSAFASGVKLGQRAVQIIDRQLTTVLSELGNDAWSAIWQPAIEEHDQNKYRDQAENILIVAYRESLSGYIKSSPDTAYDYLANMIAREYQTIHRIAINAISDNFRVYRDLIGELLHEHFVSENYRHEMWHLLHKNYEQFDPDQKDTLLALVENISEVDGDGGVRERAAAYRKAIWFAAIKDFGTIEQRKYAESVEIAGSEPDHPDFSSYTSSGWVQHESPISLEDLQKLTPIELAQCLNDYEDVSEGMREPGIEGLSKALKGVFKAAPLKYYDNLQEYVDLDLAFVYQIVEAYHDLWSEKTQLPWTVIWPSLLQFCLDLVCRDEFWSADNQSERSAFVANRYWVVSGIGRLIEAGVKSDEHAFSEDLIPQAEKVIGVLMAKESGSEFKADGDAVSVAINSPRGHAIEALINITLRSCRLSDKRNNKDHSTTWQRYQALYDAELERKSIPEYEFVTLVTNYLPNFLYMSREWTLSQLPSIFDRSDYTWWLCAMSGYSYVGTVYQEVYEFLKDGGHFIEALDDENLRDNSREKVVQNVVVAYMSGFEMLEDEKSLIRQLIVRGKHAEISQLIWFIWTLRKKDDRELTEKVLELWPLIRSTLDLTTNDGKKLASQLCHWAVFVEELNHKTKDLLLEIAPWSDIAYNSAQLLESLASISKSQPIDAADIWIQILQGSHPDYPEEAIKEIFGNLIAEGADGVRKAREIVSLYLPVANERPAVWLREKLGEGLKPHI